MRLIRKPARALRRARPLRAARVARRAVLVFDQWYRLSIQPQRAACDFDLWLKLIDRRLGVMHQPSFSAARLVRPFLALNEFRIDCRYRLLPVDMPIETLLAVAGKQLERAGNCSGPRT